MFNENSPASKSLDSQVSEIVRALNLADKQLMSARKYSHIIAAIDFTDDDAIDAQEYQTLICDITNDLFDTPYKPGKMKSLVEACELDIQELKTVTDLIVKYSVKPASIQKLIQGGISVNELEGFIDLYKTSNPEVVFNMRELEPLSNDNKVTYFVSNVEDYMSYDNMIFLKNLVNNGTADHVRSAISDIRVIKDEINQDMGVGVILHRMKNLYESDEKYRNMSLELLTRVSMDSDIGLMDVYKSIGGWNDDYEPE